MTKDALDFVGNTLDSPSPLLATVVETPPALATLVAAKLLVTEDVSVMTIEFDAVILDFACMEFVYKDNEGEGVFKFVVLVLTPDRSNWKNSMAASRPCGSNIFVKMSVARLL